ncbi:MAG: hypothetical protein M3Y56_10230, partial [Armatimonadota bacterium]|nr:hypothetical protein [Armatimonadota bacterium]
MIPITTAFAHVPADKASQANAVAEKAINRKSILGNVWFGNGKTERQTQVGGTNRLFHVAGTIGTTSCQYSYRRGRSIHFRLPIRRGEPFLLLLKELYPPDEPALRERFSVRVNGQWEANIDHTGNGFGTGTSFIPITDRAALTHFPAEIDLSSEDKQTNRNGTAAPNPAPGGEIPGIGAGGGDISITGVVALRPLETLQPDLLRVRPFSILGLVDPRKEEDITYIRDTAADPNPTPISTGFSSEIFYAARLDSALQDQIRTALTESGKLGVKFLPIWSSWWSGTPLHT